MCSWTDLCELSALTLSDFRLITCFLGRLSTSQSNTSQFCVYILYVLRQCSCSVSDYWQSGAKPGKSLCETPGCLQVALHSSGFLSTSLHFPNVIRKASTGAFLGVCAFDFELRGWRVRILPDDVNFHWVTIMFLWGKWEMLNLIKSLLTQHSITDDEGESVR